VGTVDLNLATSQIFQFCGSFESLFDLNKPPLSPHCPLAFPVRGLQVPKPIASCTKKQGGSGKVKFNLVSGSVLATWFFCFWEGEKQGITTTGRGSCVLVGHQESSTAIERQ
jgi:hypothetical protein